MRAEPIARIPQAADESGRLAPRAPGALVGGVRGDALEREAVDRTLGVVPRDLVQAGIDHRGDARHRHGCLGDVRGDDDAPGSRRRAQGGVLRRRVERAVQRNALDAVLRRSRADLVHRAADFRRARQKAQDVSRRHAEQLDGGIGDRYAGRVAHLDRMEPSRHVDDRAPVEKCRDGRGIERRRHHHDAQIAARTPGLFGQGDRQVPVHAAFVEFVEDDRPEPGQERVALEPRRQHPFGGDQEPRVGSEAPFEPDLPADLAADRPAPLVCDALRDGAGSDASRLQQDDRAIVYQGGWDAGRLPGPGLCGDDDRARPARGVDNLADERVDRKRSAAHADVATPTGQLTPVPPRPQYPPGFFARYCWW